MQITLNDCAGHVIRSFPTLIEFVAGGTLTEASGGTPPALKTGGKGVWSHTTDSTYAFRFKDFTFNAQNVFTGWTIIAGETTVDETGNANAGPATVEVYDPNGVLLASLCAELLARDSSSNRSWGLARSIRAKSQYTRNESAPSE